MLTLGVGRLMDIYIYSAFWISLWEFSFKTVPEWRSWVVGDQKHIMWLASKSYFAPRKSGCLNPKKWVELCRYVYDVNQNETTPISKQCSERKFKQKKRFGLEIAMFDFWEAPWTSVFCRTNDPSKTSPLAKRRPLYDPRTLESQWVAVGNMAIPWMWHLPSGYLT